MCCVPNHVIFMVYTLIDHSPKPISAREFRRPLEIPRVGGGGIKSQTFRRKV